MDRDRLQPAMGAAMKANKRRAKFYPIAHRDPEKRALVKLIARMYDVPVWMLTEPGRG